MSWSEINADLEPDFGSATVKLAAVCPEEK
jgi:hypothetical protein